MSGEFLVGGQKIEKRWKARRLQKDDSPPPQIGFRFLVVLVVLGASFVGVGAWRVNSVFAERDYEMETGRLQEAMRKRADRTKALAARVSELQRGEILKSAAHNSLGMTEPQPGEIDTVIIEEDVYDRWQRAASVAAANLKKEEGEK